MPTLAAPPPEDLVSACLAALDARAVPLAAGDRGVVREALTRVVPAGTSPASPDQPRLLARVLAASAFLRRFLVRHPEAIDELAELAPVRTADDWLARVRAATAGCDDEAALERALRVARHRALLGITARELEHGDPLATGADLAGLASACVEVTIEAWTRWLRPRFGVPRLSDGSPCRPVVIGMGKLGGRELNYSSDIDLIFAYTSDAGQTDGAGGLGRSVDLHTYWSRLFGKVAHTLSHPTEEGFVFRVDLDLRPEGRTGPICNSVEGLERYYESFGHAWERLAWIKARPIAGDRALGEQLIEALTPFVYRRHLDYGFADEVAAMKRRIDARGARLIRKDGFHVKLGRGGIREVEFAVQTLQLTWGGKLPELRATDTLTALSRVALAGLLDAADADTLASAYRFLRRVEHALQLKDDRQTHDLPGDVAARKRVAGVLRFGDDDGGLTGFEQALAAHRQAVRAAFEAIVAGAERPADDPVWDAAFTVALDPDAPSAARAEAMSDLGFEAPASSLLVIEALARRPESPFHPRTLPHAGGLARKIMQAVTATPDPDGALGHVDRLLRAIRHRHSALAQLEADPRRLRLVANLFGTSHLLSRLLVRSPGLADRLVFDGSEPATRSPAQMADLLAAEPLLAPPVAGGPERDRWEDVLAAVRRFYQAEMLRIGFFDLAGLLSTSEIGRQLSDLADVILARVVRAAEETLGERWPVTPGQLGVIALGKLAGRELGYGSDLDLIFVHGGGEASAMTRLARRVVTGISCATPEGTLYDIDTRLRPSGNQGPLCVSADRLREYHGVGRGEAAAAGEPEAAIWEKQAILRARAVVGGPEVEALVDELRAAALGALADRPDVARRAVADMRSRLHASTHRASVKLGPGGLIDVEFTVQFLQLTLSGDALAAARAGHPAGAASTLTALGGLAELSCLPERRAQALIAAYDFLRRLDNRLRIVQDTPVGSLALLESDEATGERAAADLRRLALRMGYGEDPTQRAARATAGGGATPATDPAATLRAEYRRHRQTIASGWETTLMTVRNRRDGPGDGAPAAESEEGEA